MRGVLIAAGLFVSGCATGADVAPTPIPPDFSAPQPVAGYDWFFNATDGGASLAFGLAESDDVRIALSCETGSGRLSLMRDIAAEAAPEIVLESGGETERFPGRSEPSLLSDGQIVTAESPTGLPVFQRFRRLGWLAVWQDGRREPLAPHPGSAANIERFFAVCG